MINVTKTYLPNKDKYKEYVDDIFESGWLTNNGKNVRALEKELEKYLGVKNVVLVSNGTLALQIAYKALKLKGDVVTTPFSFVATTSSLVWEGLNPVFADIDQDNYCMDVKKLEDSITDETSALLPVHVFGNPCDVEKIELIAKKNNLKVIYDAAHAFDVKYKGESVLNYGDISTLSFHSTKVFHAIEGGALIVNDDELYKRVKLLINFGIDGPDSIVDVGINCKMNEFQAAMGLCVLDEFQSIKMNRKKVYEYYMKNLNSKLKYQKLSEDSEWNYAYLPIEFESEEIVLRIIKELNDKEINPRRYFYPSLDTLNYVNDKNICQISRSLSKRILCIPFYDSIEQDTLDIIINTINNII